MKGLLYGINLQEVGKLTRIYKAIRGLQMECARSILRIPMVIDMLEMNALTMDKLWRKTGNKRLD